MSTVDLSPDQNQNLKTNSISEYIEPDNDIIVTSKKSKYHLIDDYDTESSSNNRKLEMEQFIVYLFKNKVYDKINKKNKSLQEMKRSMDSDSIDTYVQMIKKYNIPILYFENFTMKECDSYNRYINEIITKYMFSYIVSILDNRINEIDLNQRDFEQILFKIDNLNCDIIDDKDLLDRCSELYVIYDYQNHNKKYYLYKTKIHKNDNNSWNITF